MPFNTGSVLAKDANLADQHLATAQGDGTSGDPYLPYHGDIGVGSPDDPIATDTVSASTLISIGKAVFGRLMSIFNSIGDPGDAVATSDTGTFSLIALLKRLLTKIGTTTATPLEDYTSLGAASAQLVTNTSCKLWSIEVMNLHSSIFYFLIFNATTVPDSGDFAQYSFPVYPNGGLLIIDSSQWRNGLELSSGLAWAISADSFELDSAGAGFVSSNVYVHLQYSN